MKKVRKLTPGELKLADHALDSLHSFLVFSIKNPDILEQIPNDSYVALLPKWDVEFSKSNVDLVFRTADKENKSIVSFVGERAKKVSSDALVFLKGIISENKEKFGSWHY